MKLLSLNSFAKKMIIESNFGIKIKSKKEVQSLINYFKNRIKITNNIHINCLKNEECVFVAVAGKLCLLSGYCDEDINYKKFINSIKNNKNIY